VQLVVEPDNDDEEAHEDGPSTVVHELAIIERGEVSMDTLGLQLAETLPLGRTLHASAVRLHTLATGERLESELGPEQPMFAEGCQRDWDALPRPNLPLTVGLDGGYVHSRPAALPPGRLVRSDCW
jgi:hypothetical protein